MKNRKLIKIVNGILLSILLTGCWDKIEIDQRAFVMVIGIDSDQEILKLTYAMPNLPVITAKAPSSEKKNFIRISQGMTFYEASNDFANKSSRTINFDHTKVVIFGQDFLKDGQKLKDVLDYFDRSSEMTLSLLVIATDQSAQSLIEMQLDSNLPTGMYIYNFFNRDGQGERAFNKYEMKDFITDIYESNGNAKLPVMVQEEKEIVFKGVSFIKDYKLIYSIDEKQAEVYSWILGEGVGSVLNVQFKDIIVPYTITQIKRHIKFEKKDTGLHILINIETEGDISEYLLDPATQIFDEKTMKELEEKIQEKMEEEIVQMITLAQNDIGFDIFDIHHQLKIKEGKFYEQIKDQWNYYFTSANIQVDTIVNIRRIGMSK